MAASAVRELLVRISYALNKGSQRAANAGINATKRNMASMSDSASRSGSALNRMFTAASASAGRATAAISRVGAALNRIRSRNSINFNTSGLSGRMGGIDGQVTGLIGKFKALGAAIAGAFVVRNAAQTADELMNLDGRLRTLYADEKERASVEGELYTMSQRNRQGLTEMGDLYFKVARAGKRYGISMEDSARVTDIVSKSLTIGGASAAEASSTILQLGQALGSGVLQGDELHSLDENASLLMQHIAESMGKNIGDLKEMGRNGELTSETVIQAILASGEAVDAEFGMMPTTIGQAITKTQNLWRRFIWYIENRSKVFSSVASMISGIVDEADKLLTIMSGPTPGRTPEETVKNQQQYDQTVAENPMLAQMADELNKFIEQAKIAGQYLYDVFSPAISVVKDNWGALMNAIQPGLELFQEGVSEWSQAFEALKPILQTISQIIGYAIVGALGILFNVGGGTFKFLAGLANGFADGLKTVYDIIMTIADGLGMIIGKAKEFIGMQGEFNAAGSALESFSHQVFNIKTEQTNNFATPPSFNEQGDIVSRAYPDPFSAYL